MTIAIRLESAAEVGQERLWHGRQHPARALISPYSRGMVGRAGA
jgi:hypothetical protein